MHDPATQLEFILEALEILGVQIRHDRCGGSGGGLCTVRGQRILYVDLDADLMTRTERSIEALASLPEAETMFLPPAIRERVDKYRE